MRRHDQVYLRTGADFQLAGGTSDPKLHALVRQWVADGRPFVAARRPAQGLLLGLTLPRSYQNQRLGCLVESAAIEQVRAPLSISACVSRLPAQYAAPLLDLERRVHAVGAHIGVYGSLSWEVATGEVYRHANSDIDLICDVQSESQYHACLDLLAKAAGELPCRLDGEVRFPQGMAVAWRELRNAGDLTTRVLVKAEEGVGLFPLRALLESLEAEVCSG